MAKEALYLAATLGTGAYIAWSLVEFLSLRYSNHHLTAHASYCSPWLAVLLIPALLVARARHAMLRGMRIHKTQPAIVYPHSDPVLGLDWLRLMKASLATNSVLETWHGIFTRIGPTYWHLSIGSWTLMTNEPDNVKAMLSAQFDTWPIGGTRQQTTTLALGPHAIFSANGAEWAGARALIRPSFVRNQIADLECTDRHVENFLRRVPRDGGKVDLQPLLYMLTMDLSTDFMQASRSLWLRF